MTFQKNIISYKFILLINSCFFFFYLVGSPFSSDGAELVNIAFNGIGLPHPPGFPLLVLLNKILVKISPFSALKTLAAASVLYHLLTVLLVDQILRRLEVRKFIRVISLLIYAWSAEVFTMTVRPEKYSFFTLLLVAVLFLFIKVLKEDEEKQVSNFWKLSVATGMIFSLHYTGIIVAPLYLIALTQVKSLKVRSYSVCLMLVIPTFFYTVVILILGDGAIWPNWGAISNLQEAINSFFTFNVSEHNLVENFDEVVGLDRANSTNSFTIFIKDFINQWHILVIVVITGAIRLFRDNKVFSAGLFTTLSFFICIVSFTNPEATELNIQLFGRYNIIFYPFMTIFLAYSCTWLSKVSPKINRILIVVLPVSLSLLVYSNYRLLSSGKNQIIEIYRDILAISIPQSAIWFDQNDMNLFYGFQSDAQTLRFPVSHLFPYAWFREKTINGIEPRLIPILAKVQQQPSWTYFDLLRATLESGYLVVSTDKRLLMEGGFPVVSKGVVYGSSMRMRNRLDQESYKISQIICQKLQGINQTVMKRRQYYHTKALESLSYSFVEASKYLKLSENKSQSTKALQIAQSLKPEASPSLWKSLCKQYLGQ